MTCFNVTDSHRVGDRVTLRTVIGQLRRGTIVAVDGVDLHVEIDNGPILVVAVSEVKNVSLRARESHRRRPDQGAGRKPNRDGRRKQMLSSRIETQTWNALQRAAQQGQIPNRETAVDAKLPTVAGMDACNRPTYPIVCLIGSSRFFDAFQRAYYEETMAMHIVLSLGFAVGVAEHGETVGITPEQKAALDQLHLAKVAMADEILVVDIGGYIGISTTRELMTAVRLGKRVRWLEPLRVTVPPPCPHCDTRLRLGQHGWICVVCNELVPTSVFPLPVSVLIDEEQR